MKQYIDKNVLDISVLPNEITISTISSTCNLGKNINIKNINKYMKLSDDDIITIKYFGVIRSLDESVKKKHLKTNSKGIYNQLTVEVRVSPHKKVNIKLFKNGSLHISGCRNLDDCQIALFKLINRLQKIQAILFDGKLVEISYIDEGDIIITDFKIILINSNFKLNYRIDRKKLYNILISLEANCKFEPTRHASVDIKYIVSDNKTVSIFIFESGAIIITGAKKIQHILDAYNYINNIIQNYYQEIVYDNHLEELIINDDDLKHLIDK